MLYTRWAKPRVVDKHRINVNLPKGDIFNSKISIKMDSQLSGVIIGGGVGLISSTVGLFISHYLSVKRENEKREYEEKLKEQENAKAKTEGFKNDIMRPLGQKQLIFDPSTGELVLSENIDQIYSEGFFCFLEDSKVLMADGSSKNIQDIKKGDLIKSQADNETELTEKEVLGNIESKAHSYAIINKLLRLTIDEKLLTQKGFKPIKDIRILDCVYTYEGNFQKISSIEYIVDDKLVYNLDIGSNSFFVDGYLIGGLTIKNK